jgi:hypothetical protein
MASMAFLFRLRRLPAPLPARMAYRPEGRAYSSERGGQLVSNYFKLMNYYLILTLIVLHAMRIALCSLRPHSPFRIQHSINRLYRHAHNFVIGGDEFIANLHQQLEGHIGFLHCDHRLVNIRLLSSG